MRSREGVPVRSQGPGQLQAAAQKRLNLGGRGCRILPTDAEPGHFAGKFVQPQSDGHALLAAHRPVARDLLSQSCLGCHACSKITGGANTTQATASNGVYFRACCSAINVRRMAISTRIGLRSAGQRRKEIDMPSAKWQRTYAVNISLAPRHKRYISLINCEVPGD